MVFRVREPVGPFRAPVAPVLFTIGHSRYLVPRATSYRSLCIAAVIIQAITQTPIAFLQVDGIKSVVSVEINGLGDDLRSGESYESDEGSSDLHDLRVRGR